MQAKVLSWSCSPQSRRVAASKSKITAFADIRCCRIDARRALPCSAQLTESHAASPAHKTPKQLVFVK